MKSHNCLCFAVCFCLIAASAGETMNAVPAPDAAHRALFFDNTTWIAENNNTRIRLHRPVERETSPILFSSMEYENLRLWPYSSVVDNGTSILMYYMVMSTLGQKPSEDQLLEHIKNFDKDNSLTRSTAVNRC